MTFSTRHQAEPIPEVGQPGPRFLQRTAFWYSSLFVIIGIGAIALLLFTIMTNSAINSVINWSPGEQDSERPSLILAFLSQFGIVLPALVLILGTIFIRLGLTLRRGHIATANWAQVALMWLAIGLIVLGLINIIEVSRTLAEQETPLSLVQFSPVVLPILIAIPLLAIMFWMNRHLDDMFHGQEKLGSRTTRLAWNLLIPTLAIVIFVAGRPLEQTFIRSLTDKRFGSSEVPAYVGLENYGNLLGIRLDIVPCRLDDNTGTCQTRGDGSVRWESIDRDILVEGYRTVWTFPIPFTGDERQALALSGLDRDFIDSLWTTLVFTVFSVTLELLIGLFIAMVVNSSFAGRGFMRAVMLIPWAIPTVISARLWELILKDTSAGIVNRVLLDFNMIEAPLAWLSEPSLQVPAAIMVDVWKTSPFMALLLLAGLQTIPQDLYEAAAVDGASRVRRFFSITLPLLQPTIAVALVFRTLDALRMFDLFNVLFGRQQLSVATYNYEVLVNNQQDGYASAVSMIIFVLIGVFTFLYIRALNLETE